VIDDIWHDIKLPLKFILKGVPVLSVDTVYKSWADAAETSTDSELTTDEPSTTEPMDDQRAAICEEEPTNGWVWDGVTQDIGSNCESLPSSSHGCDRPWTQANCAYTCGSCFGTVPHFHLNITFNEMAGSNGEDAFDTHFDAIIEVLSSYLDCDKEAIDTTPLSYAGLSVKARFAISGKSEEEVAHVIDDIWHDIKLPLKFILNGVPVLSVDTVYKSWADATEISTDSELTTDEPSTTQPIDEFPYFHLNFTFNEEAGFNGAEAYKSHRDAIQTALSEYLECKKTAINATLITHVQMSAEVKFVITGMSERRVAKKIDDTWHDVKLPLKFVLKGVPVVWVDTVHTSWERNIYDSSSALLTVFMASFLVLCIFF